MPSIGEAPKSGGVLLNSTLEGGGNDGVGEGGAAAVDDFGFAVAAGFVCCFAGWGFGCGFGCGFGWDFGAGFDACAFAAGFFGAGFGAGFFAAGFGFAAAAAFFAAGFGDGFFATGFFP